eukprot:gene23350-43847_t
MLRDGEDGLQVLLMRRHQASNVLGGVYVFPGGKLDAADQDPQWLPRLSQDSTTLHQRLNEQDLSGPQAAGLFVAAMREAFEECNVLLGRQTANAAASNQDRKRFLFSAHGVPSAGAQESGKPTRIHRPIGWLIQ